MDLLIVSIIIVAVLSYLLNPLLSVHILFSSVYVQTISLLILFLLVVFIYFILVYLTLVSLKNNILKVLSDIDVALDKRSNTIKELLETAKKYILHEEKLFEKIADLRNDIESSNLENKLHVIISEKYPELNSNKICLKLIKTYEDIELELSSRRRLYNAKCNELNNRAGIFPNTLVAKILKVEYTNYFKKNRQDSNPI